MTEIFTAKTVEEAKKLAVAKFGKNINEIKFEVIEEAKKGFLGMGAKDAKVKATYIEKKHTEIPAPQQVPEIIEEKAEISEPVQETEEVSTVVEEIVETPQNTPEMPVENEMVSDTTAIPETPQNVNELSAETNVETAEKNQEDDCDYSIENLTLIEDKSLMHAKVKLAIDYITSIFRAMDIEAEFKVYQNETSSVINIESSSNGTIIGRRGETLDSIQYLCSIIANKGDKDYFRITIDCLDYRRKRKETLEQLAVKVSKSVLRTGRSQPLEPMNPYERRVIHSAISTIEGVSSHSVGEEPYRKIIISSDNPKNHRNNNKKRYNGHKNDRRNSRPKNRDNNSNFERKKVDISTSFEKDYKRPKPEDAIEGGLYGKIEL
ncbi:MAG: Jag N-terminal domain-containing protein [Ruminococcus sp.]|nr:Jag N-terminal domain-containing protein [Ruminococcus sp.]